MSCASNEGPRQASSLPCASPTPPHDADCFTGCLMGQALDGLCVGFIAMDVAGHVGWMNRAAQRLLGIDGEEAQGQRLAEILRDPQLATFWEQVAEADDTVLGEVSLQWPRPAELKLNATVSRDPSGDLRGRALLFCDVTDEKSVQVQLTQQATERLLSLTQNWDESSEARSSLTPQELRVLRQVGAGLSNEQIAREMDVAASTVRSHLKQVYRKLGLASRSEAISYALRSGLSQS